MDRNEHIFIAFFSLSSFALFIKRHYPQRIPLHPMHRRMLGKHCEDLVTFRWHWRRHYLIKRFSLPFMPLAESENANVMRSANKKCFPKKR